MNSAPDADMIKVLIVDDDLFVRQSLADYLASAPDMRLIAACSDGLEAAASAIEQSPDVVLMDIHLPLLDGIEATARIHRINPAIRILALTSFDDDHMIAGMLSAGAVGYLLKSTRPLILLEAVRAAHLGLTMVPHEVLQRWAPVSTSPPDIVLSERERQVLDLLGVGLNNRQIAQAMFLSASTVKKHLRDLMHRLDAPNRTMVIARAHALGLLARHARSSQTLGPADVPH